VRPSPGTGLGLLPRVDHAASRPSHDAQVAGHPRAVAPGTPTAAGDLASGRAAERLSHPRLDAPSPVLAEGDEAFAVDARSFKPAAPDTRYDIIVLQLGD
jgi:hypothetical protein